MMTIVDLKSLSIAWMLFAFADTGTTEAFQVSCSHMNHGYTAMATELSAAGHPSSRRKMLYAIGTAGIASLLTGTPQLSAALDMDAFISKELEVDKSKAEISDDAKTCKYAAPGQEKGDACVRAGMSIAGKNGGVNAYGQIDRGDYVRCKTSYPMINGQYVKTVTCE